MSSVYETVYIPTSIVIIPSTTVEPQTSTTTTTTSYIPPTTTTYGMTSSTLTTTTSLIPTTSTTTLDISTTTTPPPPITTTTTPDVITTTTSPNNPVTTTTPPSTTTTTTLPPITTSKDVTTSSPVPIVTVTSSGTVVRTYTSTSYSHYVTSVPTIISNTGNSSSGSNTGAIIGGAVGGVSFVFFIAIFVFITKRRRSKKDNGDNGGPSMNPDPFNHDYHTYGSPTVLSDQLSSRPVSMNLQGGKPRPFVQAYDPMHMEEQQVSQYASYEGSQSPGTNYHDYQPYPPPQQQYENNTYSHDTYYAPQREPMISNYSNSSNQYEYGRNVPDQNDYQTARRESRHVPNERPSVPNSK